ncbi:MAG TPA: glutathione peroxidase [Methylophilus sp.]|nr:glutathione peroxidase [Methylophilus sp.]HQQ33653.1 glutathione peroxidase [Methylophilus sp.]
MKILSKLFFLSSVFGLSVSAQAADVDLYSIPLTTLQGKPFDLTAYRDKPILVVNTASKCGFTPQFETLEGMYKKYKDSGLLIIGFPSNDFKQDPGSNKEIGDFCRLTYKVEFPMMSKSSVLGDGANPFYQALIAKTGTSPKWNFYKYLILPGGKEVYAYSSLTNPDSKDIMDKIKPYLQ